MAKSPIRFAGWTWIGIAVLVLVNYLQAFIYPWIFERVHSGGEGAVTPTPWFAVDYLVIVWDWTPLLGLFLVSLTTWATWRVVVRRTELIKSQAVRGVAISGALVSSLGTVALAVLHLPWVFGLAFGGLCATQTFEQSVSENGRYAAAVVEVDCGAMSSSHRQVRLTRRVFGLSWSTIELLYFNDDPVLHLSWSGRTLTISGDRPTSGLDRPPPDPMIWGGALARYSSSPVARIP